MDLNALTLQLVREADVRGVPIEPDTRAKDTKRFTFHQGDRRIVVVVTPMRVRWLYWGAHPWDETPNIVWDEGAPSGEPHELASAILDAVQRRFREPLDG
jgi:hypothetical protein